MTTTLSKTAAIYIAGGLADAIARVEEAMRHSSQHAINKSMGQPARDYFAGQEAETIKIAAEIKAFRKAVLRAALEQP